MANEKSQPLVTKKTTPRKPATGTAAARASAEPVSTAAPTGGTNRNPVIAGNEAIDLDDVRRRAYELYEHRGRADGRHAEDWLQAESEMRGKKSA